MVYNNEATIDALLESVIPYIDHYIIVDNQGGSDDDTLEICRLSLGGAGIPGEYLEYDLPFHSGNKRTFALQFAFEKAEYLLVLDADNTLEVDNSKFQIPNSTDPETDRPLTTIRTSDDLPTPFSGLDADAYLITKKCGSTEYPIVSLLDGYKAWKYTGVVHEFPELADGGTFSQEVLPGVIIHEPEKIMGEGPGQRSRMHYYNHALMIERELLDQKNKLPELLRQRYMFYLAQSYKDAAMYDRAIEAYKVRLGMGGWYEEIFYSLLQIARLKQVLNEDPLQVIEAAVLAYNFLERPRLEAVYFLMQLYMARGYDRMAYTIGYRWGGLDPGEYLLFVETETYTTLFPELLAKLRKEFKEK